jgi:hypothetical protein
MSADDRPMPGDLRLGIYAMFTRRSLLTSVALAQEVGVGGLVHRSEPSRRRTLLVLRSPARRDVGGCSLFFFSDGHSHSVFGPSQLRGTQTRCLKAATHTHTDTDTHTELIG